MHDEPLFDQEPAEDEMGSEHDRDATLKTPLPLAETPLPDEPADSTSESMGTAHAEPRAKSTSSPGEPSGVVPRPNGWRSECGAKTRSGKPCRRPPVEGRTRCRLHGGASLAGAAHPAYKHGRRSKYLKDLPKDMRAGYQAALADDELTSLRDELAVLEVRMGELLRQLSTNKSPPWLDAVEALNDIKTARSTKARDKAQARLEKLLRTGADACESQERRWCDLQELMELKCRLAGAESKRAADMQALVPTEKAISWFTMLLDTAREVIQDNRLFATLNQRLLRLLPHDPDRVVIDQPDTQEG